MRLRHHGRRTEDEDDDGCVPAQWTKRQPFGKGHFHRPDRPAQTDARRSTHPAPAPRSSLCRGAVTVGLAQARLSLLASTKCLHNHVFQGRTGFCKPGPKGSPTLGGSRLPLSLALHPEGVQRRSPRHEKIGAGVRRQAPSDVFGGEGRTKALEHRGGFARNSSGGLFGVSIDELLSLSLSLFNPCGLRRAAWRGRARGASDAARELRSWTHTHGAMRALRILISTLNRYRCKATAFSITTLN